MSSSVMVGLFVNVGFLWTAYKVPHDVAEVGFIVHTIL